MGPTAGEWERCGELWAEAEEPVSLLQTFRPPCPGGPGAHVPQTRLPCGERGREPEATSARSGVFVTAATPG